jgi:hypothetical protein
MACGDEINFGKKNGEWTALSLFTALPPDTKIASTPF